MSKRYFYKTVFVVVAVSEGRPADSIADAYHDHSDCIAQAVETISTPVDAATAAQLLDKLGSEPRTFRLDAKGKTLREPKRSS